MTLRSEPLKKGDVVLVVGGRGFVGSRVVEALIGAGYRPHVFGPAMQDDLLAAIGGGFDETVGSIENRAAIGEALSRSGARAVVTTAAHSVGRSGLMRSGEAEGDKAMAVNVAGFRNVVEAAIAAGSLPVAWASSTVVYGAAEDYARQPVDEAAPTGPLTFYGLTKELCERLAAYYRRRHGAAITGLRLPLILGPNLWYQGAAGEITRLVAAARDGKPHRIAFHDDPMDLMHVDDVARAVRAVLEAGRTLSAIYNINGFRACMSDVVAAASRRVPGFVPDFVKEPAQQTFPAISDRLFREEMSFAPDFDLDATIASLLEKETAHV